MSPYECAVVGGAGKPAEIVVTNSLWMFWLHVVLLVHIGRRLVALDVQDRGEHASIARDVRRDGLRLCAVRTSSPVDAGTPCAGFRRRGFRTAAPLGSTNMPTGGTRRWNGASLNAALSGTGPRSADLFVPSLHYRFLPYDPVRL